MTETLFDSRCPHCSWAGTTALNRYPRCGHGLVAYEVELYEQG